MRTHGRGDRSILRMLRAVISVRLPSRRPNIESKRLSGLVYKHYFRFLVMDPVCASCNRPDLHPAKLDKNNSIYRDV